MDPDPIANDLDVMIQAIETVSDPTDRFYVTEMFYKVRRKWDSLSEPMKKKMLPEVTPLIGQMKQLCELLRGLHARTGRRKTEGLQTGAPKP